jgi:hypothetical protein
MVIVRDERILTTYKNHKPDMFMWKF